MSVRLLFGISRVSYRAGFVGSLRSHPAAAETPAQSSAAYFCLGHKLFPCAGTEGAGDITECWPGTSLGCSGGQMSFSITDS